MLVATAGHIDHGKTSLVRALTGVETDRLPEERARGISIDLGFAYWRPDGSETIGFIDVPGHERFVRNMLAGVAAVDFALLVVAADDGVKPQSIEHVQILDLLGIARGIVAITKCDRSSRERIDAVRQQVQALLARTSLAGAPLFEVSCITGAGITELGAALQAASHTGVTRTIPGRNFRMALDRAFSVTGVGTVVTGTVLDGAIESGARLVISPHGLETRVRGLQSGGQSVIRSQAGERCALNLTGIELGQVHRGDWLLVPEMHAPTSRIEVRVRVLQTRTESLRHYTPVHLHLGTADIAARVLIPAQAAIPPGEEATAQLVLEQPSCTVNGDRFVLRDQSGRFSIGGGHVIDPFASGERRNQPMKAAVSAALQQHDANRSLGALLAIPGYEINTRQFERCFNLESGAAHELYQRSGAVLLGSNHTVALPAARMADVSEQIVATLTTFHREQPELTGMTPRDLKDKLSTPISAEAFLAVERDLTEKRLIETAGSIVKLPGHSARFNAVESARWQSLLPRLKKRGARPFTTREVASELGIGEVAVKGMLYRRRNGGEIWPITEERFMLRQQVAALAARAAVLAQEVGGKGFTAAQYRDAIGIGRNFTIQLLEFFDAIGVTHRSGDLRKMRPDYELVVGHSAPYVPTP
jgi:selenocysteine-specific elongation factor